MKRILFLLTMILIGVNVSFASNKKEKKKAEIWHCMKRR